MRILIGGAATLVAALGLLAWQSDWFASQPAKDATQELQELHQADLLLQQGRAIEASLVIAQNQSSILRKGDLASQWLDLWIKAAEQIPSVEQLSLLYSFSPDHFDNYPKARLYIAEQALTDYNFALFENLRKTAASNDPVWILLDADALVLKDKPKEAAELLKSFTFKGPSEGKRLTRLALLNANEHPKIAWEYLSEAAKLDPRNSDIRSFRAELLESTGKKNLALAEFVAAAEADPSNLASQEQLADFYLKHHDVSSALRILSLNLSPPSLDTIWIKAYFWNRVATPIKFLWKTTPAPTGAHSHLLDYYVALKDGQFWNQEAFEKDLTIQKYLKEDQSTYWLRILEALRHENEELAYSLIEQNTFHDLWNPELHHALKQTLRFRKGADMIAYSSSAHHPLLKGLATASLTPENKHLLKSDQAFPALLLASGWKEAALNLSDLGQQPIHTPGWVIYGLTLALEENRGISAALEFAREQREHAPLNLLIGELYRKAGSLDSAVQFLEPLATKSTEVGSKAAKALAKLYIDKRDYAKAKETVQNQPRFLNTVHGQELIAKIALHQGDNAAAVQVYENIASESSEALSFLAQNAYTEKQWDKARTLTEDLLKKHPDNLVLKENLKKIVSNQSLR